MKPLLSIWLRPGDTIEQVIGNPGYTPFVLAALGGIGAFALQTTGAELPSEPIPLWVVLAFLATTAILMIVGVGLQAWFLKLTGTLFGGRATTRQFFVLLAWGYCAPVIVGSIVSVIVVMALGFAGANDSVREFAFALVNTIFMLWSLVLVWRMIIRTQHFGAWRALTSGLVGIAVCTVASLIIALSIRAFLWQPFVIPSGSQKPTLLPGDQIFVAKYAYGYTRYSLPEALPFISGRIWPSEPQRGDLVVFRHPKRPTTSYVERVIGLPGDSIQMIDGRLHINGQPVARERVDDFIDPEYKATPFKQWRETLPNGVSYNTLDLVDNGFADNTAVYSVPPGHYFMMGDNRDNSNDSRFRDMDMVPAENLIGRIIAIYYSREMPAGAPRYGRIGTKVR